MRTVLLGIIEGHALLQVMAACGKCTDKEQAVAQRAMGFQGEGRIVGTFRQGAELFPELARHLEFLTRQIKQPQPPQHGEKPGGITDLLAQFLGPDVGVFHLWGGVTPTGHQSWA